MLTVKCCTRWFVGWRVNMGAPRYSSHTKRERGTQGVIYIEDRRQEKLRCQKKSLSQKCIYMGWPFTPAGYSVHFFIAPRKKKIRFRFRCQLRCQRKRGPEWSRQWKRAAGVDGYGWGCGWLWLRMWVVMGEGDENVRESRWSSMIVDEG